MDIKSIAQCLCAILITLATHGTCQGDCIFRFQQQPSTELSCNPYQTIATTLHATCLAIGPLHSSLQVEWWFSEESAIDSSTLSPPERVDIDSSGYRVIVAAWTRTVNSMLSEQLISSSLSVIVDSRRKGDSLCVWCQIEAPGRVLVGAASNRLCILREPQAYSDLRNCSSQEILAHNFGTVCVQEQGIDTELDTSWLHFSSSNTYLEATALPQVLTTHTKSQPRESSGLERTQVVMSTSNLSALGSQPTALSSLTLNTLSSSHHSMYTSTDTPSTYIEPSSTTLVVLSLPTTSIAPLAPLPSTTVGDPRHDSMLDGNTLTALYTAVVVCVVLVAVIFILVLAVLVMCRRHRKLKKRAKSTLPSLDTNSPKAFHSRSQFSSPDSETGEAERQGIVPFIGSGDIRGYGSEPEVLKGSIDTRSSGGSGDTSLSTEKSNSPSRKNSLHKYAEIDTISHSDSTHSKVSHSVHASLGDGNFHQSCNTDTPRGLPKVIPPPPNMRARSNSTPHFYYILEKLECIDTEEEGGKGKSRLECTWELGEGSLLRAGIIKTRSGSLKRDVGASVNADGKNEFCWEDGNVRSRSRSGSCPSREWRGGGSLKRVLNSRGGSAKSSKSRTGSGKNAASSDGSVKVHGWREGSVKSQGSRDGSFKKEVWVPACEEKNQVEGKTSKKQVPPPIRDYDVLEPRDQYPPFSLINESYFSKGGSEHNGTGVLFDDPKYATVSVGDLPRLVDHLHQSLDLIIPPRKEQIGLHHGGEAMGTAVNAASSKSLQCSGLVGGGGVRRSIYQTRDSTPAREIGMTISGNTPSRLSMPFDAYYS